MSRWIELRRIAVAAASALPAFPAARLDPVEALRAEGYHSVVDLTFA